MYRVELHANYALRELLPKVIQEALPNKIEPSKHNSIVCIFSILEGLDSFLWICNRNHFGCTILQNK